VAMQRSEEKMVKRSEGYNEMSKIEFHRTLQAKKKSFRDCDRPVTICHRRLPFARICD